MQRSILVYGFLFLFLYRNASAQEIQFELKASEEILPTKANFELTDVFITKNPSTSIGSIYNTNNQQYKATIKSGLTEGIKTFYRNSSKKSDSDRSIQMRIVEFRLTEKQASSNVASGELKIKFSYFLKTSFEPVHLVDYEAGITYQRSINRTDLVNQILNRGISNSFEFFNNWVNDHAPHNRKLANTVRLEIVTKTYKSGKDTVF
jgi:hypothetical protein